MKVHGKWSPYWRDRRLKLHEHDLVEPTSQIDEVLWDPTYIF